MSSEGPLPEAMFTTPDWRDYRTVTPAGKTGAAKIYPGRVPGAETVPGFPNPDAGPCPPDGKSIAVVTDGFGAAPPDMSNGRKRSNIVI